tara:strand:+ start:211 stop:537 length:327 start_codon:yes stop_codon:yes gene_type:complete
MKLSDSENQLATSGITQEELEDWLSKSEETGSYRGYGRHTIAMALLAKIEANQRIADMNKAMAESLEEIDLAELDKVNEKWKRANSSWLERYKTVDEKRKKLMYYLSL